MILYFTLAAREQNLSKMPPHVCFVGQNFLYKFWSKNWSDFFLAAFVSCLRSWHQTETKTGAKSLFVRDEQKGSRHHHHALVIVYGHTNVQAVYFDQIYEQWHIFKQKKVSTQMYGRTTTDKHVHVMVRVPLMKNIHVYIVCS